MASSLVTFTLLDEKLNIERGLLVVKRVQDVPYKKAFFELYEQLLHTNSAIR